MQVASLIQDAAKRLLAEGQVELVLGFSEGSLPLRSTPGFVRRPEDAVKLIWDHTCENNLAVYLLKRKSKTAIVAKGCDTRAIVTLIQENQVDRNNLYIIGVPCTGMIDRRKVEALLEGQELMAARVDHDQLTVEGKDLEKTVPLAEVLHDTCKACTCPNPVIYDELAGERVPEKPAGDFNGIEAFEAMMAGERKAYLAEELSRCIRCYACRQACPLCYCEECFVDCSTPQWIGKAARTEDNLLFQAVRVFHLAGRCADCGACERACPVGLKLSLLTRKMVKEVKDLFDYEAGLDLERKPVLTTFAVNDPQAFLVKE
ncbi:MAG TPA: 4Fe-4S ferredoxin [Desulfotomaculum sp.]|jgi:ferredoxin|nr:4Fe-4S ferredoxin [Desulfotomaculum sp.]